jgi:hypothetical protein
MTYSSARPSLGYTGGKLFFKSIKITLLDSFVRLMYVIILTMVGLFPDQSILYSVSLLGETRNRKLSYLIFSNDFSDFNENEREF